MGKQRYNIAASLETLRPARPQISTRPKPSQGAPGAHPNNRSQGPVRGFGTAISALVGYLGGVRRDSSGGTAALGAEGGPQAFVSARALVFLGGRPDHGQGALDGERYFLSQQSADTVDGDKLLLKVISGRLVYEWCLYCMCSTLGTSVRGEVLPEPAVSGNGQWGQAPSEGTV